MIEYLWEGCLREKQNFFKELNRKMSKKIKREKVTGKKGKNHFAFFLSTKSTPKTFQIHCQAEYLEHKQFSSQQLDNKAQNVLSNK